EDERVLHAFPGVLQQARLEGSCSDLHRQLPALPHTIRRRGARNIETQSDRGAAGGPLGSRLSGIATVGFRLEARSPVPNRRSSQRGPVANRFVSQSCAAPSTTRPTPATSAPD